MYRITFNGSTLYDPRDNRLVATSASLKTAVNGAGSLSVQLLPDHPALSQLTRMHGVVELTQDGDTLFRGRIVRDSSNFYKQRTIECEGLLACLNDSVVEPYDFPADYLNDPEYITAEESGNVITFWLNRLISNHNTQVGEEQKIIIGNVTVSDPNNYISRSSTDYSTTWATISEKLFKSSIGGYMLARYEDDGVYLDYLAELPVQTGQTVEYAANLLDLTAETDGSQLYTAILPIGKDKLTIVSIPDGDYNSNIVKSGKIMYSRSAEATYGRITKPITWDDVTEVSNLQRKAADLLSSDGVTMPEEIKCKACDLNFVDGTVESWRVGHNIMVVSRPHGYSGYYPLIDMTVDLLDPSNTSITLGRAIRNLTDSLVDERENAAKAMTEAERAKVDAQLAQSGITSLESQVKSGYVATADFAEYLKRVNKTISETPESVTEYYEFYQWLQSGIDNAISELEGMQGYIRTGIVGYDGNVPVPGVAVGQDLTVSEVDGKTVIEQTAFRAVFTAKKLSFYQDKAEVAYFSNNQLYVNDIVVRNGVTVGSWRTENVNGHLTDRWIGGET